MFDSSILSAFISLILIVAALGLFLYMFKRYVNKHRKINNKVSLDIISRVSLSPKNHLFVVKAEGKTLLLGATEHNINTLAELGDDMPKDMLELSTHTDLINLPKQKTQMKSKQVAKLPEFAVDDSLSFTSFLKQAFKKQNN